MEEEEDEDEEVEEDEDEDEEDEEGLCSEHNDDEKVRTRSQVFQYDAHHETDLRVAFVIWPGAAAPVEAPTCASSAPHTRNLEAIWKQVVGFPM